MTIAFIVIILAEVVGNRKSLELLLVFRFAGISLAVLSHDPDLSISELYGLRVSFVSYFNSFHLVIIIGDSEGNLKDYSGGSGKGTASPRSATPEICIVLRSCSS